MYSLGNNTQSDSTAEWKLRTESTNICELKIGSRQKFSCIFRATPLLVKILKWDVLILKLMPRYHCKFKGVDYQ